MGRYRQEVSTPATPAQFQSTATASNTKCCESWYNAAAGVRVRKKCCLHLDWALRLEEDARRVASVCMVANWALAIANSARKVLFSVCSWKATHK